MPVNSYVEVSPNNQTIVLDTSVLDPTKPINVDGSVSITNKAGVTLYPRIKASGTYWSMADRNISLGVGETENVRLPLVRDSTGGNTNFTENLHVTIEIYDDSSRTHLVGTVEYDITVIAVDLSDTNNFTVTKDTFDDGTVQGWSSDHSITVSADYSIQPNGYSLKTSDSGSLYVPKTITYSKTYSSIPTGSRVLFGAFLLVYRNNIYATLRGVRVKINDEVVFNAELGNYDYGTSTGWLQVISDITKYSGQSNVTIAIEVDVGSTSSTSYTSFVYFDEPFIAVQS